MVYHDKGSLGQNFIKYSGLVRELVEASSINSSDLVLEIGAGKGIITRELRRVAKEVIAIEKDPELAEKTGAVLADFLEYDLPTEKYKVFSNIPFSITAEIMDKFWRAENQPTELYLIMQKETAEKFIAGGQSAVLFKPWYEVEILGEIDRTNFTLKPQIKIVFVKFTKREKPFILEEDKEEFKKFVVYNFNYFLKSFTYPQRKRVEGMYKIGGKKPSEVSTDTWLLLFKTWKRLSIQVGNGEL